MPVTAAELRDRVMVPRLAPTNPPTWTSPDTRPADWTRLTTPWFSPASPPTCCLPVTSTSVRLTARTTPDEPMAPKQPRVVVPRNEQVGKRMSVPVERGIEGPQQGPEDSSPGEADGLPTLTGVPVGIARVGATVSVGVEVQVGRQLIPRTAVDAAAQPVEGVGERRRVRRRPGRYRDAVPVPGHGARRRTAPDY